MIIIVESVVIIHVSPRHFLLNYDLSHALQIQRDMRTASGIASCAWAHPFQRRIYMWPHRMATLSSIQVTTPRYTLSRFHKMLTSPVKAQIPESIAVTYDIHVRVRGPAGETISVGRLVMVHKKQEALSKRVEVQPSIPRARGGGVLKTRSIESATAIATPIGYIVLVLPLRQ